jgi:hypothetical protein
VPSEYAGKYVTVVVLDSTLTAYYEGKQVAMHLLSTEKNNMLINKSHYKKLLSRQRFGTENTLIQATLPIDFAPFEIDLEVYDV